MISAEALLIVQYLCWDCDLYLSKYCIFRILWHLCISMFLWWRPPDNQLWFWSKPFVPFVHQLCSIKYWKLKIEIEIYEVKASDLSCFSLNICEATPILSFIIYHVLGSLSERKTGLCGKNSQVAGPPPQFGNFHIFYRFFKIFFAIKTRYISAFF